MLIEKLEIQAHFKVRFLRRNDNMTRMKTYTVCPRLSYFYTLCLGHPVEKRDAFHGV